jgi:hypothetical protein
MTAINALRGHRILVLFLLAILAVLAIVITVTSHGTSIHTTAMTCYTMACHPQYR